MLAGVVPGVEFDLPDGLVEGAIAEEVVEEFGVAYGVEGVEVAEREECADFVEEAVGHHGVDASVDAPAQLVGRE